MADAAALPATTVAPTRPPAARLAGIEALRGIAATAVVLYHVARHVDQAFGTPWLKTVFQSGHAGVDLFFVLSGFIILFVHGRDIGQPRRLRHYLARRFYRVMPLYWVALALTVAAGLAARQAPPSLFAVIWSASLLPSVQDPVLVIAWTLQFELVFYAAFAVLIVNRGAGLAVFALWFGCIIAFTLGLDGTGAPKSLSWSNGLQFLMGMAAAHTLRRGAVPLPRVIAAAGVALFGVAMAAESAGMLNGYGTAARFAYGLPAAVLVLGVAAADRSGPLRVPSWLQALGQASYSIYLFQFILIGAAWQAWQWLRLERLAPGLACFLALTAAALAGGVLISRWVEVPLLRVMRPSSHS